MGLNAKSTLVSHAAGSPTTAANGSSSNAAYVSYRGTAVVFSSSATNLSSIAGSDGADDAFATAMATTTLTSSPNPSLAGQLITFTAKLTAFAPASGAPTGGVRFVDLLGFVYGSGILSGGTATASFTLPVGVTTIRAEYFGDADFGSSFAQIDQTVTPQTVIEAVGAGAGGGPHVKVNNADGSLRFSFMAYDLSFSGGVRVAVGDVNGDGIADIITGAGPGGGPHVKVFDGQTGALLRSFFAYSAKFAGGVFVASADLDGDGKADIITGAGAGGGPHVQVFSGATGALLQSFFAYSPMFSGGVSVAGGDVNGDGKADIITGAGAGGGPHVNVFSGSNGARLQSFFAYDQSFTGGVSVAAGDVNGDGLADIITGAGAGGGPYVRVFNGNTGNPLLSFFAYDPGFGGGINVAAADVNGDGRADIVTGAGLGGGPHVKTFDGLTGNTVNSLFAYDPSFRGGVYVG